MNNEQKDSLARALDAWGGEQHGRERRFDGSEFASSVGRARGRRRALVGTSAIVFVLSVGGAWLAWRPSSGVGSAPGVPVPSLAGGEPERVFEIDALTLTAHRPSVSTLLRINTSANTGVVERDLGEWSLAWAARESPGL